MYQHHIINDAVSYPLCIKNTSSFSYTYDIIIGVEKHKTTNNLLRIGIGKIISKPMRFYFPGTVFAFNINKIKGGASFVFKINTINQRRTTKNT